MVTRGVKQKVVLLVSDGGKADFIDEDTGGLRNEVSQLFQKGYAVALMDLFLTGEYQSPWREIRRKQTNYFDTFHRSRAAEQVQDIITAIMWLTSRRDLHLQVALVGLGKSGVLSLFAGAICKGAEPVICDLANLDLTDDSVWESNYYIPAIRSIGDISNAILWILPERRCVLGNVNSKVVFPVKVETVSGSFGLESIVSML